MKKKILVVFMLGVMAMSLVACGKFACNFCGYVKSGHSFKLEMNGKEVLCCDECYDVAQDLLSGN